MKDNYRPELQKATAELDDLYDQRNDLELAIAKQQRIVAAFKALVESDEDEIAPDPNLGGMTESIKSVLQASFPTPLTISQIKAGLLALHFPIHQYKNFRGSLHTVLKRISDNDLAERVNVPATSAAHTSGMRGDEPPPTEIAYRWVRIIRSVPPPPPTTRLITPGQSINLPTGPPPPPGEKKPLPYAGPGTYVRTSNKK
jgi:hypothetical protein